MSNWTADLRLADLVSAILVIGFSIGAFLITTTWIPPNLPGDPGAAFFPRISLAVMFLFSVILLLQKVRAPRQAKTADEAPDQAPKATTVTFDLNQLFLTVIYSGLLVAGIAFVGFEVSAFVFLLYILGRRTGRWVWSVITSLIAVAAMYFAFVILLQVRLPMTFLPTYLNIF